MQTLAQLDLPWSSVPVQECKSLRSLDMSKNRIDNEEALEVLILHSNPLKRCNPSFFIRGQIHSRCVVRNLLFSFHANGLKVKDRLF